MSKNIELIEKFYSAFQKLDHETMNSCYSEDIVFFDPVFGLLKNGEVKCMWEMLCKNAKDFSLTYSNIIELDEEYATCDWVATYTFSKTGKKVVNRIKANMRFVDDKIIEHSDAFSLHAWSKQAFGLTGTLFGWNSFFQNKIKNTAKRNLLKFISSKNG
ncbi:MAG: nuclear transport factor 2 family protein [Bacteroidota bacterium]